MPGDPGSHVARRASRPAPFPAWWAEASGDEPLTLHLGPLDAAEARALAGAFLAANASLAERCVERAAGNPLFLEQLLRNAEEERGGTAVPGSVQSLVQARLDRAHRDDRIALQAASVLGQRFDLETLRHLLGQPDRNVERIAELSLVRPQGERSFLFAASALVRDAVYDSMLRSRRRELHRRAAEWCEGRDAALRAEHLDRADDPGAPRAYLAAAEGGEPLTTATNARCARRNAASNSPATGPTASSSALSGPTSCTTSARCRPPCPPLKPRWPRHRTTASVAGR